MKKEKHFFFGEHSQTLCTFFQRGLLSYSKTLKGTKGILRSSHSRCFQLRLAVAGTKRSNLVNVKAGEEEEEASLKGCLRRGSTVKSRDTLKIYFYFENSLICDVKRRDSKNHRFVHHALDALQLKSHFAYQSEVFRWKIHETSQHASDVCLLSARGSPNIENHQQTLPESASKIQRTRLSM